MEEQDGKQPPEHGTGRLERDMSKQSELLKEVAEVVAGARNKNYGPPSVNLDDRTARLWSTYFAVKGNQHISGIDVCNLMILLKMARIMEDWGHKDNYADMAGYAAAAWEIADEYVDRLI
jgi:glycyl-tRNA synthetase (class II)